MGRWWIGVLILGLLVASPLRAEVLRVAMEGAYPPFEEIGEDGKLKGFNVDIANALCEQMEAECELVRFEWDDLIPALDQKRADMIVASMSITEERLKQVDFTEKYTQTPAFFFAREGLVHEVIITPRRLAGKRIGVQRDTTFDSLLTERYGTYAQIERFDSATLAYDALSAGQVDMVFDDAVSGYMGFLNTPRGAGFERVGGKIVAPKYLGRGEGIAVRKDDTALKDRLNEALTAILDNGTYKRIERKYFQQFSVY
ncbi:transporter substrate-binding domain-containing protein [Zestomonas carbonaria]|uniref:ABC transporter arginine-binding protein 1 n=1 Tax=Zestomonas carbonaria TaxID=2762745 RepID=A0A7U7EPG7_9GAMM|nr:transporter substrate-binding domain-containing protein [Pseudomonas carbonaria]CAD5108705.1 ABC transporter arginine-binding protein 1 [Pseudomonas carbonaria]